MSERQLYAATKALHHAWTTSIQDAIDQWHAALALCVPPSLFFSEIWHGDTSVSYTHLTLPTILRV